MQYIVYVVIAAVFFTIGFAYGSTKEWKRIRPIGQLVITKENDLYLQVKNEESIQELREKDFAFLGVIKEPVAKNAPSITE
jgi:hypothetical protein